MHVHGHFRRSRLRKRLGGFPQYPHLSVRNREGRQPAMQTDYERRKHPDDWFIQTFEPGKVDRNFAVKRSLAV